MMRGEAHRPGVATGYRAWLSLARLRPVCLLAAASIAVGCKSDAACRTDPDCTKHGLCRASWGSCVAATRADCQQSEDCTVFQACTPANGACRVSDADCQQAKDCRVNGACKSVSLGCIVANQEDCQRSEGCRQWGACGMWIDVSNVDASEHALCVPHDPLDCKSSERCRTHKECTYLSSRKLCIRDE